MITISAFIFSYFQENTYILHDESGECVIIDAGCYTKKEEEEITEYILNKNLKPVKLLNTHGHLDHTFGNAYLIKRFGIKVAGNSSDLNILKNARSYGESFGVKLDPVPPFEELLTDGDIVSFGNSELKVIATPGHTPGGLCFYSEKDKFIITGDTLFCQSIGRTDLPGGDYETLISSIKEKILTLPGETAVYSGHGPKTTIEEEARFNPFL